MRCTDPGVEKEQLAATPRPGDGSSVKRSRRRRGCDVDIPWRRVAATPRLRRVLGRRFRGDDVCSVESGARLRYQLLGVLFEAPAATGSATPRSPAPSDEVLASAARLVARVEAVSDPAPYEPFHYEGGGKVRHVRPPPPPARGSVWHYLAERRLVGAAQRLATAQIGGPAAKLRAYVSRLDEFGRSPLDVAARNGSPEMCHVLLAFGAELAAVRFRCECGPRVLAELDAGRLPPSFRIRASRRLGGSKLQGCLRDAFFSRA